MQSVILSGAWVGLIAVAMTAAAARALAAPLPADLVAVVGLGAFAVYAFDRLRDVARDRARKPARVGFVGRHRRGLTGAAGTAATIAVALGLAQPRATIAVLAAVVLLALLHAPLKKLAWIKPTYIAVAWLLVVLGLPITRAGASLASALGLLLPLALAIVANVLACDAADREAEARAIGVLRTWWLARGLALAGVIAALVSGTQARPLAVIPLSLLVALIWFRPTERYTAIAIDGALLVGAGISMLW